MPGVYTIRLDPSVPPVQHARCKVPIECREAIEKLLQDMVDQEIITPVTEPTEWVSSLTYPQKPDGSLHICLDPKDLNKAIIREHYKAPTLDEITHKLSGAKVFSKLDAKDGFWSIHLDTQSSYLTTFNMHKGCYWFLCMPVGLKMSQDVFQMWMDQITDRLPGVIAIHNDICENVYNSTRCSVPEITSLHQDLINRMRNLHQTWSCNEYLWITLCLITDQWCCVYRWSWK